MIRQYGEVAEVTGRFVRVRVQRRSACDRCHLRHGCGAGIFARAFPGGHVDIEFPASRRWRTGEQVVVALPEGGLLRAAAIAYLVPLIAMLAGTLALAAWGEAGSIAGGLGGFAAGCLAARWLGRCAGRGNRFQPVLLEQVPDTVCSAGDQGRQGEGG